jgi:putative transposase
MPSSLTTIWIHAFFSTKNRSPLIQSGFESNLFAHIKEHLEHDYRCYLESVNGTSDHLHLLFLLNPNYSLKDILKNIKGESSHWINSHDFIDSKFAWQKAYAAASVSDTMVKAVEHHIKQQREFHKTVTYLEEYRSFFTLHRLQFKGLTD